MMNLQFLEDGPIPALDGVISEENQSLILEVLFWTVAYTIYVQVASRVLRAIYRMSGIWTHAHKRIGVFIGNGRDDAVLLTCLGLHHGFAAYLMYLGMINENPSVWRHGYLIETGFEVADFVSMALSLYPYTKHDGIKPEIQAALVVHHLPGILLSVFVMETGLYKNTHMQKIVICLLGGALVTCLFCIYIYTLNFETQMVQAAIAFNLNVAMFFYCRWYVFPTESLALLADVKADPDLSEGVLIKLLYAGGVFMGLFNIGITVDVLPKCVRYIMRAMDGVTAIETEAVPKSRDSVLFGSSSKRRSRRSSVMMAVNAINPIADQGKRSSIATIMGMNAIEDVWESEKETERIRGRDNTIEEDTDLDKDDLAALNRTVSSMSDKKKS